LTIQNLKVSCTDGFELAATIFKPDTVLGAIMIAPATGIKKEFYKKFAGHLATNGYGVICFDNRGIGASKKGNINAVNASLINWGRLDMPAILNQLIASFPNQSYHIIGHSAGGQLVGLMHNASKVKSLFNFASSSGEIRNMPYPFRISAAFYLNYFIRMSNFLFDQTNSQWVGMGEPLPKLVAQEWTRWCNGSGYIATDFGKAVNEHFYDELDFPSHWLRATDDPIASLQNVKDMKAVFTKSQGEILSLDPKDLGRSNG